MKLNSVISVFIFVVIMAGFSVPTCAQEKPYYKVPHPGHPLVYKSDTLPLMHIPAINIYDANKFSYLKSRKYRRIIRNVKKAYPYAIIAKHQLKSLDKQLALIESKKEQREYMRSAEKEIIKEFEGELRHLTVSQGIILVKLIDREIGITSYEVVKEIRGGFTAFFWQGIAKLFGNNLKLQYDPTGDDKVIEDIILAIDQGFV